MAWKTRIITIDKILNKIELLNELETQKLLNN